MLKYVPALAATVSLFLAASCSASTRDMQSFPKPSEASAEMYRIAQSDMPALEKRALEGDGDAALSLCLHYEYAARQPRESMFWLRTAAEDGNKVAARRLGELLQADNNDVRHYLRAPFWLKKAME